MNHPGVFCHRCQHPFVVMALVSDFVEHRVGGEPLPVVISVPHGGHLMPDNIPDRNAGAGSVVDTIHPGFYFRV